MNKRAHPKKKTFLDNKVDGQKKTPPCCRYPCPPKTFPSYVGISGYSAERPEQKRSRENASRRAAHRSRLSEKASPGARALYGGIRGDKRDRSCAAQATPPARSSLSPAWRPRALKKKCREKKGYEGDVMLRRSHQTRDQLSTRLALGRLLIIWLGWVPCGLFPVSCTTSILKKIFAVGKRVAQNATITPRVFLGFELGPWLGGVSSVS